MNTSRLISASVFAVFVLSAVNLTGCASNELRFSVYDVSNYHQQALFNKAEVALKDSGYRIEFTDTATGQIMCYPRYYTKQSPGTARHPNLRRAERWRTVVEVKVPPRSSNSEGGRVMCRAAVQIPIEKAYALLELDQSRSDLPNETPIDSGIGDPKDKNQVWQTKFRDRKVEQEILSKIVYD